MTQLATCSYSRWRPGMGQPVVASLTLPRWIPDAQGWPRCWEITPRAAYLRRDPAGTAYRAQLDRYGVQQIAKTLEAIARQHQAGRLCVLCFEADDARCHRSTWATWWIASTGERVTELM